MRKVYQMLKEIKEQAEVVERMINKYIDSDTNEIRFEKMDDKLKEIKNIKRFVFLGNGSSSYAALFGNYIFEEIVGLSCEYELADEFISRRKVVEDNTGVIVLSQSGETGDILEAIKQVKKSLVFTLCITNTPRSTLSMATDAVIVTSAGQEKAITATKSFTAELVMLIVLALYIDQINKTESTLNQEIINELENLPKKIREIIDKEKEIKELAKHFIQENNFVVLGRHYQYPIALEGAQKLKETAYIQAEGMESEEFRHGPVAIVDKGFSVISLIPDDKEHESNLKVIEEVIMAKGRVYPISDKEITLKGAKPTLVIPRAHEMVMPVLSAVPLQFLAYYIAVGKGINVDKLRNIFKYIS